jgi:hypothetical protein
VTPTGFDSLQDAQQKAALSEAGGAKCGALDLDSLPEHIRAAVLTLIHSAEPWALSGQHEGATCRRSDSDRQHQVSGE